MERITLQRLATLICVGLFAAGLVLVVPESHMPGITRTVVLAGAAMTLNILIGNVGLISMGHGLFIGIGAYALAIANVKFGLSMWLGFVISVTVATFVGSAVAAIALRARHLFFSLLTLAIGQVGFVLVTRNYGWTGGDDGLVGIAVPDWLQTDIAQHLLAVATTSVISGLILVILASPFGVSLRAVRDNTERVASLGANPKLIEFSAMVLAGVLAAICGTVLAVTDQSVGPATLSWVTSATLLVMVALGGRSMFYGPILGVVVVETLRNFAHGFSEHSNILVGLVIICCAIAFPEGIASIATRVSRARLGRKNTLGQMDSIPTQRATE